MNLIDRMLVQGINEPSSSPWSSPVMILKKKNGDYRLVTEFRKLNSLTVKNSYDLPNVQVIFKTIGDARTCIFSILDLQRGFYRS